RSLIATTSMSRRACSTIERRTSRPMRPNPLMATRTVMVVKLLSPAAARTAFCRRFCGRGGLSQSPDGLFRRGRGLVRVGGPGRAPLRRTLAAARAGEVRVVHVPAGEVGDPDRGQALAARLVPPLAVLLALLRGADVVDL